MSALLRTESMNTLDQHAVDPHHLIQHLHRQKETRSYVNEETHTRWFYTVRQRSRLFLLAKPDDDHTPYREILAISPK